MHESPVQHLKTLQLQITEGLIYYPSHHVLHGLALLFVDGVDAFPLVQDEPNLSAKPSEKQESKSSFVRQRRANSTTEKSQPPYPTLPPHKNNCDGMRIGWINLSAHNKANTENKYVGEEGDCRMGRLSLGQYGITFPSVEKPT